jgi:glutaminyl-tRNA synthetase
VAKRDNLIDLSLLEFCIREDLNKSADRVMAVLDPIKLVITNYPADKTEDLQIENNPEAEVITKRSVPFSNELYIEREDFMIDPPKKFFRLGVGLQVRFKIRVALTLKERFTGFLSLMPWRLRYVTLIAC